MLQYFWYTGYKKDKTEKNLDAASWDEKEIKRMKRMKRFTAILLTMGIFCTGMTGCGAKTAEPASVQNAEEQSETESGNEAAVQNKAAEEAVPEKEEASATIQWINATYALLTYVNNSDWKLLGGYEKNEFNQKGIQQGLVSSWDVTDRKTAEETLDYLLTEGHRSSYAEEMKTMEENGFLELSEEELKASLVSSGFTDEQAACYTVMADAYKAKGEQAIDAWDYCRALQLLGWYYIADYYTEQETLDQSLEIAKQLQASYGSWEELMESYLLGFNYWSEDDPSNANSNTAERRAAYEELKAQADSPYQLDWNTALEKTW